jgi:hypothetical protein
MLTPPHSAKIAAIPIKPTLKFNQAAGAHVPLTFAPGESYQFDWSHEIVVMTCLSRRRRRWRPGDDHEGRRPIFIIAWGISGGTPSPLPFPLLNGAGCGDPAASQI